MSRRYRRLRRRGYGIDVLLAGLLLAFCVFTWVWWIVQHSAVLVVTAGLVIVAFWAGCRWKRRRAPKVPVVKPPEPSTRPLPQVPDAADQVALLERLAGRPMDAIIASYQLIQRKYGGPR